MPKKKRPPQTPEYTAWQNMKSRCYGRFHRSLHRYRGRGITVCDRWLHSFENFLADMGKRPSADHSLDRIDNDGNYEPSNCRWATYDVQQANKPKYKIDLSGRVFGKLRVLQWAFNTSQTHWHCVCECGNTPTSTGANLTSNRARSCGRCVSKRIADEELANGLHTHPRCYRCARAAAWSDKKQAFLAVCARCAAVFAEQQRRLRKRRALTSAEHRP